MDTFIIYHEVLMSLTAHMHRETPMNPEAVATEVATNLDALGALMSSRDNSHSSGHVTVSPVPTNDAATQYEGVDVEIQCSPEKQKERPVCIVTPLGFSESFAKPQTTSNSAAAAGNQNQNQNLTSPVPGPSGTTNAQPSEVDSNSNSPLSYNSYEMISDSDDDVS